MRLPSFNDFSPELLKQDIRICLQVVKSHSGSDDAIVREWARLFFGGKANKRSSTNIPATLNSTGLSTGDRPIKLSAFGEQVLAAPSAREASQVFCAGLLKDKNGMKLLEAIRALEAKREPVTKVSLKQELQKAGIEKLSTATTDHTTLKNWMVHAGILTSDKKKRLSVDDSLLRTLIGIGATEHDEFASLPLRTQIFLELLRKRHTIEDGPFKTNELIQTCLKRYPTLFDESQFAKEVREPLVAGGWLKVDGLAPGTHGGKSGWVAGSAKLLDMLAPTEN